MSRWIPFQICERGEKPPRTRGIETPEGVGDRLRTAAFAEVQARDAFEWAAATFEDAPEELKRAWRALAKEEDKHLNWLLNRMRELKAAIDERPVSVQLWESLTACKNAREFSEYMATAEERGRKAGERFHEALAQIDPESARIFGQIAKEEVAHIRLAMRFFDFDPTLRANGLHSETGHHL